MEVVPRSLSSLTLCCPFCKVAMELALLFFLSALVVTLIDWVGSDSLASLVRPLLLTASSLDSTLAHRSHTQFYAPFAPAGHSTRANKAEILDLRAQLAATSSQDEFSKWARLRRKLDKAVQDLEATTANTSAHRTQFNKSFKSALWVVTTVAPFVVSSWHRKSPVFWLPRGWFGPLGWWLSFPSAPAGAPSLSRRTRPRSRPTADCAADADPHRPRLRRVSQLGSSGAG